MEFSQYLRTYDRTNYVRRIQQVLFSGNRVLDGPRRGASVAFHARVQSRITPGIALPDTTALLGVDLHRMVEPPHLVHTLYDAGSILSAGGLLSDTSSRVC